MYETLRTNDQRAYFKTGKVGTKLKKGQTTFVGGLDYQAFIAEALEEAHTALQGEPVKDLRSDMRALCAPRPVLQTSALNRVRRSWHHALSSADLLCMP